MSLHCRNKLINFFFTHARVFLEIGQDSFFGDLVFKFPVTGMGVASESLEPAEKHKLDIVEFFANVESGEAREFNRQVAVGPSLAISAQNINHEVFRLLQYLFIILHQAF